MKYRYNTVTGKHEIEVDEQLYAVLHAMDRAEYNSDRKYRRHNLISLSNADYDGEWMEGASDALDELIRTENREHLNATLAQLTPDQQLLVEQIVLNDGKIVDIARKVGVSEVAIRGRLKRIYGRMKKILE